MKLKNIKAKNATSSKTVKAVAPKQSTATTTAQPAKGSKGKPAKKAAPEIKVMGVRVALMTGKRSAGTGGSARLVQLGQDANGAQYIRAIQNRKAIGTFEEITAPWGMLVSGVLRAPRVAALPLGGFVAGGKYGGKSVKVQLFEPKAFDAMLKPATVKWTALSKPQDVLAMGDNAQKGIHAIRVMQSGKPFYWGFETDSWAGANEHERGSIEYGKVKTAKK